MDFPGGSPLRGVWVVGVRRLQAVTGLCGDEALSAQERQQETERIVREWQGPVYGLARRVLGNAGP